MHKGIQIVRRFWQALKQGLYRLLHSGYQNGQPPKHLDWLSTEEYEDEG